MTRRGWWLVVANLLLPGSAQLLAGSRRLGRFGVRATGLLWLIVVAGAVVFVLKRTVLLDLFTRGVPLLVLQALLIAYGLLWIVLTLDTLRLVRLVRIAPASRVGIALFTVAALVAVTGTAGYGSLLAATTRNALHSIFAGGPSVAPIDGRYNIMLLGGDSGPDRDGLRPDSMSVVSIDAKTGTAVNIGLPRNLDIIPFPKSSPMHQLYPQGYGAGGRCDVDVCQLNSIYTEVSLYKPYLYPDAAKEHSQPGIEATRDALEGATGLTIQYYVLIDMAGFAQLVNALGGVTIDVKERLPIGGQPDASGQMVGVTGWIEPGKQHMNGHIAQWYARSRESTSDYDRMARQRQLEDAILRQMSPVNVAAKFRAVSAAGTQVVSTNIPQSMLSYFVQLAEKTKGGTVRNLELVPPLVPDPSDPDWPAIHADVRKAIVKSERTGSAHG